MATSLLTWANNASSTLAAGISNSATSLTLVTGTGAKFPQIGSGQYFKLTLNDAATGLVYEIMHCTAISGDTLTVVRGQEGTSAVAWLEGDLAANIVTAGTLSALVQSGNSVNSGIGATEFSTYAGNPNGNVAGAAGSSTTFPSLCWDTTDSILWACTTTGTSSTAVWTGLYPAQSRLAHGECRFNYTGPTVVTLSPYNGCNLLIAGTQYQIPSAGVTGNAGNTYVNGVAGQAVAASTLYYVYAFISSGAITLDFRTGTGSGYMPDTTAGNIGVEVRNNSGTPDSTRTLVGMVYTNAGASFQDIAASGSVCGVLSWFNRRERFVNGAGTASSTSTSGSLGEITTGSRIYFLCWADDPPTIVVDGNASNSSVATITGAIGIDGSQQTSGSVVTATSTLANAQCGLSTTAMQVLSEGWHYATPFGAVSSGTGTFNILVTAKVRG